MVEIRLSRMKLVRVRVTVKIRVRFALLYFSEV